MGGTSVVHFTEAMITRAAHPSAQPLLSDQPQGTQSTRKSAQRAKSNEC